MLAWGSLSSDRMAVLLVPTSAAYVGWITLDIQLTIPAGTTLVQGTAVQDVPHTRSVHAFLPPGFGDGHPQQIQAAPGVVTIMVKRVPEGTAFPPAATPVQGTA
jgi:hypothetical protein